MVVNQLIKEFIRNASELKTAKNKDAVILNLQNLSIADDMTEFDTTSFEAAEFYTLLHDLLVHHSTEFEITESVISVLQVIIRNPNTSSTLENTYHFIQPLTTLLETHFGAERKIVVLRIIQELSYGVKICWQEAHLPKLIGVLLDIIMGDDSDLIPIALGIMVNICYKNKPAVYTLVNCIDIKAFVRIILNLQRKNVETGVQVCKLLMALNHLSGNVPDSEILSFVRVSFLRINKAFTCGNILIMRHIIDFFRDAKESEHGRKVLLSYPKYQEETENLINALSAVELPNNWQCVQQLIEFIQQLVDPELVAIVPLYTQLTSCVLPWLQVPGVSPSALELLSSLLHQCRSEDIDVYKAVCSCMEQQLQMLVVMLHNACNIESSTSKVQNLTSLLRLFRELAANSNLRTTIADSVDKEELKKVLIPLMSPRLDDGIHLFQQPVAAVYVEVLSFVSELSLEDKEWLYLYSDLLQKKQILNALALALYSGSYEVKKQILYLAGTTSFSKDCLTVLSKCLTDLNQLFPFPQNANNHHPDKEATFSQTHLDYSPCFTKIQREGLDILIEKLDHLIKNNQINNASIPGIIELYNYKLAEMRRAEQCLQSSLVAVDSHRTQLSHRVAQLSAETNRLHQLLYSDHQVLEGSQLEIVKLRQQLHSAQESAGSSHVKFKQLKQDIYSKSIIINDQNNEISKMKEVIEENGRKYEKLEKAYSDLTEKNEELHMSIQKLDQKNISLESKIEELNKCIKDLETNKSDLQKAYSKLEEKLSLREKVILEKEVLIENKMSQTQSLEKEIVHLQSRIKGLEKTIKEKEKAISALKEQLVDLERMRKLIFEISGGKKS